MDLHGNVSKKLAEESDLITCYRMAPHEDAMESKQRALDNLIDRITNGKGNQNLKLDSSANTITWRTKQVQELSQEKVYMEKLMN